MDTYLLVIFFLDSFLVKLVYTSSPSFISFCARTTTLPVGDTKNLKRSFLGFLREEVVHLLLARQLWERNEKLGKSHRPFLAPMKAALVRKIPIGWNNMLRTTLHPDGDDDYEYEQLSMRANDCKY